MQETAPVPRPEERRPRRPDHAPGQAAAAGGAGGQGQRHLRLRARARRAGDRAGVRADHPAAEEVLPAAARDAAELRRAPRHARRDRRQQRAADPVRRAHLRHRGHPVPEHGLLRAAARLQLPAAQAPDHRDRPGVQPLLRRVRQLRARRGEPAQRRLRPLPDRPGRPLPRAREHAGRRRHRRRREVLHPGDAGPPRGPQGAAREKARPLPQRGRRRPAQAAGALRAGAREPGLAGPGRPLPGLRQLHDGLPDLLLLRRARRVPHRPGHRPAHPLPGSPARASRSRWSPAARTSARRRGSRQRHRYFRKFAYPVEKYHRFFCTGCGRCSRACMAGIKLKETLNTLAWGQEG